LDAGTPDRPTLTDVLAPIVGLAAVERAVAVSV